MDSRPFQVIFDSNEGLGRVVVIAQAHHGRSAHRRHRRVAHGSGAAHRPEGRGIAKILARDPCATPRSMMSMMYMGHVLYNSICPHIYTVNILMAFVKLWSISSNLYNLSEVDERELRGQPKTASSRTAKAGSVMLCSWSQKRMNHFRCSVAQLPPRTRNRGKCTNEAARTRVTR